MVKKKTRSKRRGKTCNVVGDKRVGWFGHVTTGNADWTIGEGKIYPTSQAAFKAAVVFAKKLNDKHLAKVYLNAASIEAINTCNGILYGDTGKEKEFKVKSKYDD